MKRLLDLAGFFAAHAVWCVSDGGPLIPFGGCEFADGTRRNTRFIDDDELAKAVAFGKEWIKNNPDHADRSVFIYDGYVTLGDWRTDGLFLELRSFLEPRAELSMVIPYRSREDHDGFAVYRPKFLAHSGVTEVNYDLWANTFFAGVDTHEQGAKVWMANMDQSR